MSALNNVMILAAGKGERLKPLTDTCHKSLLRLPGGHTLGQWLKTFQEAQKVIVNVHHLADQVTEAVQSINPNALISFERTLLDSGGGIRHVLPYFDCPFWVANSDVAGDLSLMKSTLASSWLGHEGMRLLLTPTPRTHPGDYDISSDGRLTYRRGGPLTVTGLHIAQPYVYQPYPDGTIFSNRRVWDDLEQQGKLYGAVFEGEWIDIGTHERLKEAGFIEG